MQSRLRIPTRSSRPLIYFLTCLCLTVFLTSAPLRVLAQGTIQVVVHYVEGKPLPGKAAYQTQVFATVYDAMGNPVEDLQVANFTVSEDSRKVELEKVEKVGDIPLNVVLVLDTSGTMIGQNIEQAKQAAGTFINSLEIGRAHV